MKQILVLQGPNLDRLGTREPGLYGRATLAEINQSLDSLAQQLDVSLEHYQSAHEGSLIEAVHRAADAGYAGALLNAGGYTHTSVGLRDAFLATGLAFVEVHLSNIYARESFRHRSLFADIAQGIVVGFGPSGYELGLRGLVSRLAN